MNPTRCTPSVVCVLCTEHWLRRGWGKLVRGVVCGVKLPKPKRK